MGGSGSPLLQLSFDPRLRRGSRAVMYLLKKGQPLCEGAGKKRNIGGSDTCNSDVLHGIQTCFLFLQSASYIYSFILCPCYLTKVNTSIKMTLEMSCKAVT